MSVYIGNLSYTVTSDELTQVFNQYGVVKRVQLPMDRETGQARGFAFVEMETDEQEDKAIEELNEAEWMGREPVMAAGTRPVKSIDRPVGERADRPARNWVDRSNGWSDGGSDSGTFQRR